MVCAGRMGIIRADALNDPVGFYRVGLKFNMQGKENVGIAPAKTRMTKVDGSHIGEYIAGLNGRHAQ